MNFDNAKIKITKDRAFSIVFVNHLSNYTEHILRHKNF